LFFDEVRRPGNTSLPPHLADAVQMVEYDKNGNVSRIELHDQVRALQIKKHLGAPTTSAPSRSPTTRRSTSSPTSSALRR